MNNLIISGYGLEGCNNLSINNTNLTIPSPSFFVTSYEYLFTITEDSNFGIVYSYKLDENLTLIDSLKFENSSALCHITYSNVHKLLFVSCWGSGDLIVINVEKGKFVKSNIIHYPSNNKISRVHFSMLNKAQNFLYVNNVGLDEIYIYELADSNIKQIKTITAPNGTNPRHSVLSSDEKLMYVVTEKSNEILVYELNSYNLIQRMSTLNKEFEKSNCSSIVINNLYNMIYVANRYSESIASFSINNDGLLTLVDIMPCLGIKPRHMVLSKNSKKLMICYETSNEIYIHDINENGIINKNSFEVIKHNKASCIEEK